MPSRGAVLKILLDTCAFLWLLDDSPALSTAARSEFVAPSNEVFLSTVSAWEIAVKHSLGGLTLPKPPGEWVPAMRQQHGIESLVLTEEESLWVSRLPMIHRDPFDRMLISQAMALNLTLLTSDATIRQYPVRTFW